MPVVVAVTSMLGGIRGSSIGDNTVAMRTRECEAAIVSESQHEWTELRVIGAVGGEDAHSSRLVDIGSLWHPTVVLRRFE